MGLEDARTATEKGLEELIAAGLLRGHAVALWLEAEAMLRDLEFLDTSDMLRAGLRGERGGLFSRKRKIALFRRLQAIGSNIKLYKALGCFVCLETCSGGRKL